MVLGALSGEMGRTRGVWGVGVMREDFMDNDNLYPCIHCLGMAALLFRSFTICWWAAQPRVDGLMREAQDGACVCAKGRESGVWEGGPGRGEGQRRGRRRG